MITGNLTVFPRFGNQTYVESKTKEVYRHLPCVTTEGLNIYITVLESTYKQYQELINENNWSNQVKFMVWGELKSANEKITSPGLSNLYIRADLLIPENSDKSTNVFSINAHSTKTIDYESTDLLHNYFFVAANKNILTSEEKRNKPSYAFLKTNKRVEYKEKDIIQGTVKIISVDGELRLEVIHTVTNSSCRKLVEALSDKYNIAS